MVSVLALNDTPRSMPRVEVRTLCPIVPRVDRVSAASSAKQLKKYPTKLLWGVQLAEEYRNVFLSYRV